MYGIDREDDRVQTCRDEYQLTGRWCFRRADIIDRRELVDECIAKCDVVLPLVAIATPATYVNKSLKIFELDFEENLRIIRKCLEFEKHVLFPSTSEVYGMCTDDRFKEYESSLVLGPVHTPRWIYSSCKQLLDRVMYALHLEHGLRYTLFRPFNWIGPRLDRLSGMEGSARVITQFVSNVLQNKNLELVDGGHQSRAFCYVDDAIEAMMILLENLDKCNNRIFNIGNPDNVGSIMLLANLVRDHFRQAGRETRSEIVSTPAEKFYGKGYQDMSSRVPDITEIRSLGWEPRTSLGTAVRKTVEYYVEHGDAELEEKWHE